MEMSESSYLVVILLVKKETMSNANMIMLDILFLFLHSNVQVMSKHHKHACLKEIGLHLEILISDYSTFNSEHNWEDL